jgi:hypothetical protein
LTQVVIEAARNQLLTFFSSARPMRTKRPSMPTRLDYCFRNS